MPYEKTAEFYDLIYSNKPYVREAEKIACSSLLNVVVKAALCWTWLVVQVPISGTCVIGLKWKALIYRPTCLPLPVKDCLN